MVAVPWDFWGPEIYTKRTYSTNLPNHFSPKRHYGDMSKIAGVFSIKKITMVCKKSPEYIIKPYICQTFKPASKGLYSIYGDNSITISLSHPRPRIIARIVRHCQAGITKIITNLPSIYSIKPSNLFSGFCRNIQTFLYFLLVFCRFIGHFCTFCTGFLSIKGLTNWKVWGIICIFGYKV